MYVSDGGKGNPIGGPVDSGKPDAVAIILKELSEGQGLSARRNSFVNAANDKSLTIRGCSGLKAVIGSKIHYFRGRDRVEPSLKQQSMTVSEMTMLT